MPALPGIGIAYLFAGTKDSLFLMLGAAVFAWFGGIVTLGITSTTRIKQDAALGITLSVFFGLGIVLLTYLQGIGGASQGGLDRFLFGQAAALIETDVINLGILAAGCFVVLIVFFKEFKIATFDSAFGQSFGFSNQISQCFADFGNRCGSGHRPAYCGCGSYGCDAHSSCSCS